MEISNNFNHLDEIISFHLDKRALVPYDFAYFRKRFRKMEDLIKNQFLIAPYKKFTLNDVHISISIEHYPDEKRIILQKLVQDGFIKKINGKSCILYCKERVSSFNIDTYLQNI